MTLVFLGLGSLTQASTVLSAAVSTPRPNTTWGERSLFSLTLPSHRPSLREVRVGTQAGTEAETMEGCSRQLALWLKVI